MRYCFLLSLWLYHRSQWIIEYPQSWNLHSPTALSEICWCTTFPCSWFQSRWQSFCQAKFFQTTRPSKKLSEKYLGPYEIIVQPGTLSFTPHLPESMCSVHLVFHVSMLKPATSNTFSERIQPAPTLVIIDRESKYEISWIVDSKIDCWQACKLLYKVIWLEYEDTGDEYKWIPTSELTHAANLVSDFHITYSTKPGSLPLF